MLMLLFLFIAAACRKNDDCADCAPSRTDLLGTWTVTQTNEQGAQFDVELTFNQDNTFLWEVTDTSSGHISTSAAYALSNEILTFKSDPDCNFDGLYYVYLKGNKLAIMLREDSCAPRVQGLEWVWTRK